MTTIRRLQLQSAAALLVGAFVLASPRAASATPLPSDCGVCFESTDCSWSPGGGDGSACQTFCDMPNSSECIDGIPGGWVCDGTGVYRSFVYCSNS